MNSPMFLYNIARKRILHFHNSWTFHHISKWKILNPHTACLGEHHLLSEHNLYFKKRWFFWMNKHNIIPILIFSNPHFQFLLTRILSNLSLCVCSPHSPLPVIGHTLPSIMHLKGPVSSLILWHVSPSCKSIIHTLSASYLSHQSQHPLLLHYCFEHLYHNACQVWEP